MGAGDIVSKRRSLSSPTPATCGRQQRGWTPRSRLQRVRESSRRLARRVSDAPAVGPAYFSAAGANLPRCTQISRSASGATRQFPTPGCAQTFHGAAGACQRLCLMAMVSRFFWCCSAVGSLFFPQPALTARAVRKSFRLLRGRRCKFPRRAVRKLFAVQRVLVRRIYAAAVELKCSDGRLRVFFSAAGATLPRCTQIFRSAPGRRVNFPHRAVRKLFMMQRVLVTHLLAAAVSCFCVVRRPARRFSRSRR